MECNFDVGIKETCQQNGNFKNGFKKFLIFKADPEMEVAL